MAHNSLRLDRCLIFFMKHDFTVWPGLQASVCYNGHQTFPVWPRLQFGQCMLASLCARFYKDHICGIQL